MHIDNDSFISNKGKCIIADDKLLWKEFEVLYSSLVIICHSLNAHLKYETRHNRVKLLESVRHKFLRYIVFKFNKTDTQNLPQS